MEWSRSIKLFLLTAIKEGVLNSDEFAKFCLEEEAYDPFDCDELDPRAIKNLKHIVDETSAGIVLSSAWRWEPKAFEAVRRQLQAQNLDIMDTTLMELTTKMSRTEEIQDYLNKNPNIINYVILDDTEIKEPLADHWVRCLFKNGLTKKLAEEAIRILKEK